METVPGERRALVETAVRPQAMRAAGDWGPGSVRVLWMPRRTEQEEGDEELGDESSQIAGLVQKILAGDERFRTKESSGPRIGLLCRTAKVLRRLGQALDHLGIPYSASHRAGFFSQPAVVALETALRALTFREDDISLIGLLRGPIFAWSDLDLLTTRKDLRTAFPKDRWTHALRRGEGEDRCKDFGQVLARWQKLVAKPSVLLRQIIKDSGLDITFASLGREGSLRDLWRFIELVEVFERSPNAGLVDLLAWIRSQRASANEGAALAPADDIPVVLTTIHGSKGLEFPIVVVPGLSWRGQPDYDFIESELPGEGMPSLGLRVRSDDPEDGFERVDSLLTQVLGTRAQARVLSEEKRLFYVACTRAREHLILPIEGPSKSKSAQLDLSLRSEKLRSAKSYRELLLIGSQRDDDMNPSELRFADAVRVPVIEF